MRTRTVIGFAIGPIGSGLLGLITVPAVAWLFSPADVGRMNVFQVSLSFTLLLTVLGLDQAYVREFHETKSRDRLLLSCFMPGFLLLVGLSVLSLPFASSLATRLYDIADSRIFLLTLLACYATYISRFLSLILRMNERGWAYSASQVFPKLLTLLFILSVPLFGLEANFHTLQVIMIVALLAVLVAYGWNTRQDWQAARRERVALRELRPLLSFGLPLILSGLAYWGLTATSTFALRTWSSLDELAVYSVTNSFAGAAVIFQSIFATIWAPTVYKWVAQGVDMRKVDDVARHALVVVCMVFVGIGLFSWLTDYVLPSHYRPVKYLLACAVAPSLLYTLSEITTVGIGITRRTGLTIWITLAALMTNVLLSWWWVPRHGAAGAVLANGMAFFVFFVLRTEVSAALWRQFPRAKLYAMLGLMLAIASTIAAARGQLPNYYPAVWLGALVVALLLLFKETKDLFAMVMRYVPGGLK